MIDDLTPDELDQLESAHKVFDRGDGVAKARLLAALTAEGPPRSRSTREERFEVMRRNGFRMAMAATIVVAAVGLWQLARPRNLFAQAARAMIEAKGYECDLVMVEPGYGGGENTTLIGHAFCAAGGEERLEHVEKGEVRSIKIHRPGADSVELFPDLKQYEVFPASVEREFSFSLFARLGEHKGKAGATLGPKEVGGVKAEGFVVPWSKLTGDDTHPNAKMNVWLDPSTSLPARVDVIGLGPTAESSLRLDGFRWGAQDPKRFDTSVPAGYTRLTPPAMSIEEITEYVVLGLSTFAKYNDGKYPAVKFIYGDEQGEALRKLMGVDRKTLGWTKPEKGRKWIDPKEGEFSYGGFGLSQINVLQREKPEFVYNGKTVTARDARKVLLRWKLLDGQYRVIFGDLKAETVSADRLKVLESK